MGGTQLSLFSSILVAIASFGCVVHVCQGKLSASGDSSQLRLRGFVESNKGAVEDPYVGRRLLAGHHPPGSGHHPPGHGTDKAHHPPGHGHHPANKGHHPPHSTEKAGGHHPPGHGHHPPKSTPVPAPAPSSTTSLRTRLLQNGEMTSAKAAMNALEKDGRFKSFHRLLSTFKLNEEVFDAGTMLAPTDAAFEAANEEIIRLINSVPVAKQASVLTAVLLHHMQKERLMVQGVKETLSQARSPLKIGSRLDGQYVMATLKADGKLAVEVLGAKTQAVADNEEIFLSDDVSVIGIDRVLLMPSLDAYTI